MPRTALIDFLSESPFSLHMDNGTAAYQVVSLVFAGVLALMMAVGWCTRLAAIVSWVLLLSLQNRNTVILSDEVNPPIVLLFWVMFLPLGARYSVDASLTKDDKTPTNAFFSAATLAL